MVAAADVTAVREICAGVLAATASQLRACAGVMTAEFVRLVAAIVAEIAVENVKWKGWVRLVDLVILG
jgi:hypothetical protein